ncbi:MAG: PKD domain-containing protein [Flavobacteriales bacterium]|nr:PKD domain-containing protein [Flavobacteriales bacterium]
MRFSLVLILSGMLSLAQQSVHAHEHDHQHAATPLRFIENKGQWDQRVQFMAGGGVMRVFLEQGGLTWSMLQPDAADLMHDMAQWPIERQQALRLNGHAWKANFIAPTGPQRMLPVHREAAYHNYYLGNDPARWAANVGLFGEVMYEGVWPGIDVLMRAEGDAFKYDVILAPGANPHAIGWKYEGLEGLSLDATGRMVMRTSVGEVIEMAPVAFYGDGAKEPLDCRFVLKGNEVGFVFPHGHDARRTVIIDPLLIASTLSGATGASNYGHCATFDDNGFIYTGARNFGPTYPVTVGAFQTAFGGGGTDVSISRYNPDGSQLLYATYLGGSSGENPHSLIANNAGQLVVFGTTASSNFPTSPGCYDNTFNGGSTDIFITVLNTAAGGLTGSTFVGGSQADGSNLLTNNYGDTYRGEVIFDGAGNICVSSCTSSSNFPATAGAFQGSLAGGQDAVVFSLNLNCSNLLWSSFLGGSSDDMAFGLRAGAGGAIYVTGGTASANFPTLGTGYLNTYQGGTRDAFVVRITANASGLTGATFLGGAQSDQAMFIDLDQGGNVWLYGQSDVGITVQPAGTYGSPGGRIFIAKLDPALATMPVSSTLGAAGGFGWPTAPVAFLVDVCDHIYISGYNSTSGLPVTPNNLFTTGSFYLAAFDVDMAGLLFGTYYGGSHVDGGTSRFDKDGLIYQGVCSGMGSMTTTPWAWATNQTIGWDIGVFKIDFQVAGVNAAGASTLNSGCAPIQIDFSNTSTGTDWIWDFGDGSPTVSAYEPSHIYTTAGSYTVMLIAMDSLSCNLADTIYMPITIGLAQPLTAAFTAQPTVDCTQSQVVTTNQSTGAPLAFVWDMGDGTQYTDTNVVHTYLGGPGTYAIELLIYDPTGCSQPDSITQFITVPPPDLVEAAFTLSQVPDCDELFVSTANASTGPSPSYQWNMGDGTLYNLPDVTHLYTGPGTYTVTLIATDPGSCNQADTTTVQITVSPTQPVTAAFTVDQVFDCAQMVASTSNASTGTFMQFVWSFGDGTFSNDTNVTHTYNLPGSYTVTLVVSDALGCSPPDTATAVLTIDPLVPVVAAMSLSQFGPCVALNVQGVNLSTGDSVTYSWDMGDGTVLNTTDVTHTYPGPGTYTVTLVVTDLGCGQNDQVTQTLQVIDQLVTTLVPDAVLCPGVPLTLDATAPVDGYLWNTGQTTSSIVVNAPGTYYVDVFTAECQGADTVEVVAAPSYDLSYELHACPDAWVTLEVPLEGQAYSWSTGGQARQETVQGDGTYIFTVTDFLGCQHTDTVRVLPLESEPSIFAPNAFSPNGDGVNDVFVVAGVGEQEVKLEIFNRWGEQLFVTTSLNNPWDGRYNGALVKQDVYVYRLQYTGECTGSDRTTVMGHVTVLR